MHRLLEDYLSLVAAELKAIPAEQREEDLREMRQHLMNAVTVNQDIMGQDEEQAVVTALEDFGAPKELAAEMLNAWRRGGKKENWRSLAGSTLCSMLFLSLGCPLFNVALRFLAARLPLPHGSEHRLLVDVSVICWALLIWALIGVLNGMLFPRRAIAGTCVAVTMNYLIGVYQIIANQPSGIGRTLLLICVYITATAAWTTWWVKLAVRWRKNRMPGFPSRLFQ